MQQENKMEFEIDLLEIFNLLKRKILFIAIVTLFGALLGFVISKFFITPMYESSVNMIVNTRNEGATNVTNDNITSAQKMVGTYAIIIKSNTVLNKVIANLNLDMDYNEVREKIDIHAIDSTQVMKVSMRHEDPETSKKIIEQISMIAPSIIVDAVEAGSCKVIGEIEAADRPVSPNVGKNTAIMAVLFMFGCIVFVVLKELLSNYIEDDSDVQKQLGLPVLGIIPEINEVE